MKTRHTLILVGVLILTLGFTVTDYLIVSRNATLKEKPNGDALIVGRVNKGDYLQLLSTEQTNGYFHVNVPNSSIQGWVYRTFVRRYKGKIPVDIEETPVLIPSATESMVIRVLDVGAGLCVAIKLTDGKYIIYDAGHYRGGGKTTLNQLKEVIPAGSVIEQLILSHTDGDHIGAASNIIEAYHVKKVVNTGYEKSLLSSGGSQSDSYKRLMKSISDATYPIENVNLNSRDSIISTGVTNTYDEAKIIFLCGFNKPLPSWNLTDNAEKINSVSIVAKLEYKGVSVLLTGDAVGRHRRDTNPNALIATEKYLVENASQQLNSDILIAPHHGGDNSSSTAFIGKVSPKVVIFSAGHDYNHPYQSTADRYLRTVDINNMFRTDRGDDEKEPNKDYYEWDYSRIAGCSDSYGDDDVEIVIDYTGKYKVRYVFENAGCVE